MRQTTIARNYAEALLELGRRANDPAGFGRALAEVAEAVRGDLTLRRFLESPRASADEKNAVLGRALGDQVPRNVLRFLQALVTHRRQMLIPVVSDEYQNLLDQAEGRTHAEVTLAKPATDDEVAAIAARLSAATGRTVVPHVTVNPAILGGIVVKMGDTVMDGSVRRRLVTLRARLGAGR